MSLSSFFSFAFVFASVVASRATDASTTQTLYFDQLVDHNNPSLGTFKQRFFFNFDSWGGPGSPIFLFSPGEQPADGYETEFKLGSTTGFLMNQTRGAGVVLEHRYWGKSSPFQTLSTGNLRYLTLDQSLEDFNFFVRTVVLPLPGNPSTHPDDVPWVTIGGSYAGLLSAFVQNRYHDVFAAGWASSAPVHAIGDYWQYWLPIQEGMPKNCSTDVSRVIQHVDSVLGSNSDSLILDLKSKFNLQSLENDDFADALNIPLTTWQDMQPDDYALNGTNAFYKFCDALEVDSSGNFNGEEGVGLELALERYAKVMRELVEVECGVGNIGGTCLSTYNYSDPYYTDLSVSGPDGQGERQWLWLVCTEFGWFQTGDPGNCSSIVSSFVTEEYNLRQCRHLFPPEEDYSLPMVPQSERVNALTKGWNLSTSHLFVANGEFDPWRSASLASDLEPNDRHSVVVIQGGIHTWDLGVWPDHDNVNTVVREGVRRITSFIDDWYYSHPNVHRCSSVPSSGGRIRLAGSTTRSTRVDLRVIMTAAFGGVAIVLAGVGRLLFVLFSRKRRLLRGGDAQYFDTDRQDGLEKLLDQ